VLLALGGIHVVVPAFETDVTEAVARMLVSRGPCYLRLGVDEAPPGFARPPLEGWRKLAAGPRGTLVVCGPLVGGVLAALGVTDRRVWLADSFAGLPEPDLARDPLDVAWQGSEGLLAVPEDEVRRTFQLYGLLDDAVRFLPGWFADTLPTAPVEHLAVLRLDGDLYRSTLDALTHLYPKVSPGGFVIIDDYAMASCRAAVEEYRAAHGIDAELVHIDLSAVWWRVPLG